jgi:dienelactone hydrolase
MKNTTRAVLLCGLALTLAGCGAPQVTPQPVVIMSASSTPAASQAPGSLPTPEPAETRGAQPVASTPGGSPTSALEPGPPVLPVEPQRVEFQAQDGARLVGLYYPAANNPAPLVVLMHWAGGNKDDWVYLGIASWLQNRGLPVPPALRALPFDTPYPFEPLPAERSYGVFLFDFRNYGESEKSSLTFDQLGPFWLQDAAAAYQTAAGLPGVDPARIAGIGASIGADAVVDACGDICRGTLSLGPGGYLGVPYTEAVQALDSAGNPVWCVAAEDDSEQACNTADGEHYQAVVYPKGGHAMSLFRYEIYLEPKLDEVVQQFLVESLGE